jgi:hypothetical protein
MNFLEGTRFTDSKAQSPLAKKLQLNKTLPPKSGGVAFVLNAMGHKLTELVDVTIFYPEGIPSFWDFICGKVNKIVVHINTTPISNLMNDQVYCDKYFTDEEHKAQFQNYLNQLWQNKDLQLEQLDRQGK